MPLVGTVSLCLVSIWYVTSYLIIYLKMIFLLILGLQRSCFTDAFSSRKMLSDWLLSLGRIPPFEYSHFVLILLLSVTTLLLALLKFMCYSLFSNIDRPELWFVESKLWHKWRGINLGMQSPVLCSTEENKGQKNISMSGSEQKYLY